jgi:RNA polymerase sigma-70 factor, ECF subfamily
MDSQDPNERAPSGRLLTPSADLRFTDLVCDHQSHVHSSLRRLGVEARNADDATQDVFTVIARKLDRIEPGSERSYATSVAARVAANHRRRANRAEVFDTPALDEALAAAPDAESLIDAKRRHELLNRAIDSIPAPLRQVLILSQLEGLTTPQVAKHCGIPTGTAASQLSRARDCLRRAVRRRS